jgi:hypothetical protein
MTPNPSYRHSHRQYRHSRIFNIVIRIVNIVIPAKAGIHWLLFGRKMDPR